MGGDVPSFLEEEKRGHLRKETSFLKKVFFSAVDERNK